MGTFISTAIVAGLLYLFWRLTKIQVKVDDISLGVDNPYYDNKVNSMPLDKYEKELDKIFDYDKISTIPLNPDEDETTGEVIEEKVIKT